MGSPEPHGRSGTGPAAVGCYALMLLLTLLQQPGRTTYDTRAELTERPLSFLQGAFTMWHPETDLGEIQNQAYGYLFPQGPWFVLMQVLHMPDWIAQRLWTALLLAVAAEGVRRVALAFGARGFGALLAGLVYALSPRFLGTVGVISAETLPGAVMPWVLLPVLLSVRGRMRRRHAVLLSAAAVVAMGGVNAVENAGALLAPVIIVLWAVWRRLLPGRFLAGWAAGVGLASLWWVLPLLVLAGSAPSFYEFVESAGDTTSPVGWAAALRGDSHWIAYLDVGGRAWWPAAYALATTGWLVVVAGFTSAVGLVGLLYLPRDRRAPLVASAVVGLLALGIAHGGWAGSPVAEPVRHLLDGGLQIFRNVHKVDPAVRLPIAIGCGQAACVAATWVRRRGPRPARLLPLLGVVSLAFALVPLQTLVVNEGRQPGWSRIPDWWLHTQRLLAEHDDGRATLVVPGSGFALQDWGWTVDEPLLVLGGTNMAARTQVPLVPGQSIRYLDTLDGLVTGGTATGSLREQLARAGIGHVVLRRDLDPAATESPAPGGAAVSLADARLDLVASFGPQVAGGASVDVFDVPTRLPDVRSTPVDDVRTVLGAPESILAVQQAGLVRPGEATVLEDEPGWRRTADVVTDGNQRRERAFGRVDDATSAVMGARDPWRTVRASHDYPTVAGEKQVVAGYDGLRSITASSSQGYADTFGAVVPQGAPYSAVDGDRATRWVSSPVTDASGQWLRLTLASPTPVHKVTVLPVADDDAFATIREIEVRAGRQSRRLHVDPTGAAVTARFDGASVAQVEVRILSAGVTPGRSRVGLREVAVDDLAPRRTLVVPGTVRDQWVFSTGAATRACRPSLKTIDCDVSRIRAAEEAGGMDRTFTTAADRTYRISGLVMPRATPQTQHLLDPYDPQRVSASSVYGADPMVAPRFVYDGQLTTSWVSAPGDLDPTLTFDWSNKPLVTSIRVRHGTSENPPVALVVKAGRNGSQGSWDIPLNGDIPVRLPHPVRTTHMEVSFRPAPGSDRVEVPEIGFRGRDIKRPWYPAAPTGAVCGLGPQLVIDGKTVPTEVSGTVGDVRNGSPLHFETCRPDPGHGASSKAHASGGRGTTKTARPKTRRPPTYRGVALGAGEHRLRTVSSSEYDIVSITGTDGPATAVPATVRPVRVRAWASTDRTVVAGPGAASVLDVPESFNSGWVATSGGHRLKAIRVDGWRQGWVLPAGGVATVRMVFAPQRHYIVLIWVGLVAAGFVLAGGLLSGGLHLARGAKPAGAWPPSPRGVVRPGWGLGVATTLVALPLGGLVTACGALLGWLCGRQLPLMVGACTVASALIDGIWHGEVTGQLADAVAALAIGGLVVGGLVGPRRTEVAQEPAPQEREP